MPAGRRRLVATRVMAGRCKLIRYRRLSIGDRLDHSAEVKICLAGASGPKNPYRDFSSANSPTDPCIFGNAKTAAPPLSFARSPDVGITRDVGNLVYTFFVGKARTFFSACEARRIAMPSFAIFALMLRQRATFASLSRCLLRT